MRSVIDIPAAQHVVRGGKNAFRGEGFDVAVSEGDRETRVVTALCDVARAVPYRAGRADAEFHGEPGQIKRAEFVGARVLHVASLVARNERRVSEGEEVFRTNDGALACWLDIRSARWNSGARLPAQPKGRPAQRVASAGSIVGVAAERGAAAVLGVQVI